MEFGNSKSGHVNFDDHASAYITCFCGHRLGEYIQMPIMANGYVSWCDIKCPECRVLLYISATSMPGIDEDDEYFNSFGIFNMEDFSIQSWLNLISRENIAAYFANSEWGEEFISVSKLSIATNPRQLEYEKEQYSSNAVDVVLSNLGIA